MQPVDKKSWRIRVWVQPRAKRSELAGLYQGCLKVRISSPPVDDKANKELCSLVATLLDLKKQQVIIENGHTSRQKTLLITSQSEPVWKVLADQ